MSVYKNNPRLKACGVPIEWTLEQLQEYEKCRVDPVYFTEKYVKIISVDDGVIPFKMYEFQKEMLRTFHGHRHTICKLPRQVGKCLLTSTEIKIKHKYTNAISGISIGEFHKLLSDRSLPMIDDGSVDVRKFTEICDASDYEVWTDTGWETISTSNKTIPYEVWKLNLVNGISIKCADNHIVFDANMNEIFVKDLNVGDLIHTECGLVEVDDVVCLGYEKEMYDLSVDSTYHRFYSNGILSHNSTVSVAYMLHYMLFNEAKTVAILANKGSTAREILSRLKMAFELLPHWLQQGVKKWNEGSIEFENGSEAIAGSTSSSAIRGLSISCVSGDSFIKVKHSVTNEIKTLKIAEFARLIDGKEYYTETQTWIKNSEWNVDTPTGWQAFDGVVITSGKSSIEIEVDGKKLQCTPNHKVLVNGQLIEAKELEHALISEDVEVYDLTNVNNGNLYYTNHIVSKNCLFLDEFAFLPSNQASAFFESVYPTISSGKDTKMIIVSTPKGMNLFHKKFVEAEEGRSEFKALSINWWDVPGRDEEWKRKTISTIGEESFQQEFACLSGDSKVTVRDENGEVKEMTMKELYSMYEFKDNHEI